MQGYGVSIQLTLLASFTTLFLEELNSHYWRGGNILLLVWLLGIGVTSVLTWKFGYKKNSLLNMFLDDLDSFSINLVFSLFKLPCFSLHHFWLFLQFSVPYIYITSYCPLMAANDI